MNKIIKVFIGLIAFMIIGIIGITALSQIEGSDLNPLDSAKNAALNTALDASGIKDTIQSELESRVDQIAAATGLSTATVQQGIDNLAIHDWTVTSLPSSAQATGTIDGSTAGIDGTLTTYADSSYVTVDAYGQSLTLAVPESAQAYLGYLSYLQ